MNTILSRFGLYKVPFGGDTFAFDFPNYFAYVAIYLEKTNDFQHIRQQLAGKLHHFPSFYSKVINWRGYYFLKLLNQQQIEGLQDELFQEVHQEIHTDAEICEFILQNTKVAMPQETPQFRAYFISNVSKDESCLILKFHHGLCDGASFRQVLCELAQNIVEPPLMRQLPLKQRLLDHIHSFVKALLGLILILVRWTTPEANNNQNNLIDNQTLQNLHPQKFALLQDFSFSKLKNICGRYSCTINDIYTTLLLCALFEHFQQEKVCQTHFKIKMPVYVQPLMSSSQNTQVGNSISFCINEYTLHSKFEDSLKEVKAQMNTFKNSTSQYESYWWVILFTLLPRFLQAICARAINHSLSCVTHFLAPKIPLIFGGNKSTKLFTLPFVDVPMFMMCVNTHLDIVKVSLINNRTIIDVEKIQNAIDETLQKLCQEITTITDETILFEDSQLETAKLKQD